jgi:hypothetical protein
MHTVGGMTAVCRKIETEYREGPDPEERLEKIGQILSEGVYAYLRKGGLLAAHRPRVAEQAESEDQEPGGEDSP